MRRDSPHAHRLDQHGEGKRPGLIDRLGGRFFHFVSQKQNLPSENSFSGGRFYRAQSRNRPLIDSVPSAVALPHLGIAVPAQQRQISFGHRPVQIGAVGGGTDALPEPVEPGQKIQKGREVRRFFPLNARDRKKV